MFINCILFLSALVGVAFCRCNDSDQCVISYTEKGTVYSWGNDSSYAYGYLGLQNNYNSPTPSPIQNGLAGVRITQVSCGYSFNLALSNNGKVSVYKTLETW